MLRYRDHVQIQATNYYAIKRDFLSSEQELRELQLMSPITFLAILTSWPSLFLLARFRFPNQATIQKDRTDSMKLLYRTESSL